MIIIGVIMHVKIFQKYFQRLLICSNKIFFDAQKIFYLTIAIFRKSLFAMWFIVISLISQQFKIISVYIKIISVSGHFLDKLLRIQVLSV